MGKKRILISIKGQMSIKPIYLNNSEHYIMVPEVIKVLGYVKNGYEELSEGKCSFEPIPYEDKEEILKKMKEKSHMLFISGAPIDFEGVNGEQTIDLNVKALTIASQMIYSNEKKYSQVEVHNIYKI